MIKAILLLAGNGKRLESPLPKQYHFLGNKRLYLHTLEPFLQVDHFVEILLVCEKSWHEEIADEVARYSSVRVVVGGETRQQSSYLGLCAAGPLTEYVVIHDGVRPFVSKDLLMRNIEGAHVYGAVNTCISSPDTIVHAKENSIIEIPKRAEYLRGQTPQSFSYPLILRAHQEAKKRGACHFSDDCGLVVALGEPVFVVEGDEKNFKITTAYDLTIAETLLFKQGLFMRKI